MPNPITTGTAGGHRTHAEVALDTPPRHAVPSKHSIEYKTREALRLAWDLSLSFYQNAAQCTGCGVKRATVITAHKDNCKVGRFEVLAREVLTGYIEA
jgi:hypothetical protein